MKISIITVFPELYSQFLKTSLIERAQKQAIVEFNLVKLSDLCDPKVRIDEPVCGPGAGMIIKPTLLEKAIETCEEKHGHGLKVFFSPQGKRLDQPLLQKFAELITNNTPQELLPHSFDKEQTEPSNHLILVCSRYEGIDARIEKEYADAVVSIGDYVLMGGDLPAQVFIEGLLRLIPSVVGKGASVEQESFSSHFLDYPEYGLPKTWKEHDIPEIILSGNHGAIERWRKQEAARKTVLDRFDWFRASNPTKDAVALCKEQIPNHYVAIMHSEIVLIGDGGTTTRTGCSSITSLDLHDTARSCATYGIKNMFMVSPLKDQQSIMNDLLTFWKSDDGKKYNSTRFEAVSRVTPTESLQKTIGIIEQQEGTKPLVVTTSAKIHEHAKKISYQDQGRVWRNNRPVLFLFGTAQGLCDKIIDESDYLLVPVNGMTNYTHLSVRSAIAIILDRWLGLNPKNI